MPPCAHTQLHIFCPLPVFVSLFNNIPEHGGVFLYRLNSYQCAPVRESSASLVRFFVGSRSRITQRGPQFNLSNMCVGKIWSLYARPVSQCLSIHKRNWNEIMSLFSFLSLSRTTAVKGGDSGPLSKDGKRAAQGGHTEGRKVVNCHKCIS